MLLENVFTKESIIIDLESTEKDELFEEMVEALHNLYPDFDREQVLAALKEREAQMSTGILHAVAVPHAFASSVHGTIGAIGISREGIDYEALDGSPVKLVFMLVAGEDQTEKHIQILKSLALLIQKKGFVDKLISCKVPAEAYDLILQSEVAV